MQGGKYSSCELVFEARAAAEEAEARAAAEAAAKKAAEEAAARKLKEEAEAREALVGEGAPAQLEKSRKLKRRRSAQLYADQTMNRCLQYSVQQCHCLSRDMTKSCQIVLIRFLQILVLFCSQ